MKIQIVALFIIASVSLINSSAFAASMTCNKRQSATNCMICNCYHETRGETFEGMVAVNKVVLSRSEDDAYPSSICGVVYDDAQFSWTQDRIGNNINATKDEDKEALEMCKKAVNLSVKEGPNDVIYYYNPSIARPYWARRMTNCGKVGNHTFLVPRGESCPKKLGVVGKYSSSGASSQTKKSTGVK